MARATREEEGLRAPGDGERVLLVHPVPRDAPPEQLRGAPGRARVIGLEVLPSSLAGDTLEVGERSRAASPNAPSSRSSAVTRPTRAPRRAPKVPCRPAPPSRGMRRSSAAISSSRSAKRRRFSSASRVARERVPFEEHADVNAASTRWHAPPTPRAAACRVRPSPAARRRPAGRSRARRGTGRPAGRSERDARHLARPTSRSGDASAAHSAAGHSRSAGSRTTPDSRCSAARAMCAARAAPKDAGSRRR